MFFHGDTSNLVEGVACPSCKRVVGHHIDCPDFKPTITGESSRRKLFDAASVLWGKSPDKSFITFTLPSLGDKGTYQLSSRCSTTGDLAVTEKFSKVLEAWSLRHRRSTGQRLSFVWVAEAQMKRQQKFGGIGDLHFHLVANVKIKEYRNGRTWIVDQELVTWLQDLWCQHIGVTAANCVHVDPIPDHIRSIPGYLTKYLGKGSQRHILSRKFGASRDLTRYKPITLTTIPTADLVGRVDLTTKTGYELSLNFFNTREILEEFGGAMIDESRFVGVTRTSKDFSPQAIQDRADKRTWDRIREMYQDELSPEVG